MNKKRAIIKVDNSTDGTKDKNYGRASVYLISTQPAPLGSLVLLDADHLPFGCSVWPSFFTQGPNWPQNGEIDIVENVNLANVNRYALHTYAGCELSSSESSSLQTGSIVSTACNDTINNEGCVISDPSQNSFGPNFAKNGGGVYATLFDTDGIKLWFFERNQVPSDVKNGTPTPGSWSAPSANYLASSCDPTKFFGPQSLTLYINICGKFAGNPDVFGSTCPGKGLCSDLVQVPNNYNDAYFAINYIRVFKESSATNSSSSSKGTSSSSGNSPSPSQSGGAQRFNPHLVRDLAKISLALFVFSLWV